MNFPRVENYVNALPLIVTGVFRRWHSAARYIAHKYSNAHSYQSHSTSNAKSSYQHAF